jgi:hypothetical protein
LSRSTSTVARDSVRPVRVALIRSDATVLVLDQILVGENCSSGKVDSSGPQRVRAGVLGSAQSDSRVRVPATQLRDAAGDVHSLAEVGRATLVECDTSVGGCGAALAWSGRGGRATGPGCVGCGCAGTSG